MPLHGRTLTADQLDAYENAFRAYAPPPFVYAIRGERLVALAQTDESYDRDRAKIPASAALRAALRELSADLALSSSRTAQHRIVGILYDAEITLYDPGATDAERARADAVLDWYANDAEPGLGDRLFIPSRVMPGLARTHREGIAARAHNNAMLTTIAIERHRLETGTLPASLDALPPAAQAHTIDPFHPAGAPFGYAVDNDADAPDAGFGVGYRLHRRPRQDRQQRAR
ncbi:MAG: hypothetical protein AAGH64_10255 [Planctomycetota bacterium]